MQTIPDWLSATLASDAAEGQNVLPAELRALTAGSRAVGPAFVVLAGQDDNQVIRRVLSEPPAAGQILVVSGHSHSRAATVGGLIALELKQLGFLAVVTDGFVRDTAEIRALGLPIWCRGATPIASAKLNPGVIGSPVKIGDALIRPGDLVIADDDGVVVWPEEAVEPLLVKAQNRLQSDQERLRRIQAR